MAVCSNCGNDNPSEALFCEKCGTSLTPQGTAATESFEGRMEAAGKKIEEAFEQVGKKVQEGAAQARKGTQTWWDQRLGIASPIVSGLLGVIAVLIVVIIMDAIAGFSAHERFWQDLVDFVINYIWLFVFLIFLNAFSEYLIRRYRGTWRWVRPVPLAIGFFGWFWIFAQVLEIGASDLHEPSLGDLGNLIELILPLIFVLVLAVGYLALVLRIMAERAGAPAPR